MFIVRKNIRILCGVLFVMSSVTSAQDGSGYRSPQQYQSGKITVDTLLDLAPACPPELKNALDTWLLQEPVIVKLLSGVPGYMVSPTFPVAPLCAGGIGAAMYDALVLNTLMNAGYNVKTEASNYVIALSDDWFLKASSISRRLKNLTSWLGKQSESVVAHADAVNYVVNFQGSIQLMSRMAIYLRIKELAELEKLTIQVPEMYFVHLPDRPTIARDENYVIIERSVGTQLPFLEETSYAFDANVIRDLVKIVAYTGLASLKKNILVNEQTGMVYLVDLEQPDTINPYYFFNGDLEAYQHDIIAGWNSLMVDIIEAYAKKSKVSIPEHVHTVFNESKEYVIARINGTYTEPETDIAPDSMAEQIAIPEQPVTTSN